NVELLDAPGFEFMQPLDRVKPVVATIDKKVGHVEQQATVAASAEFIQELRFRKIAQQLDVSSNVFQKQRPPATLRQLERVIGNDLHELPRRAHRVQMAKVGFRRAGEGDVLADPFGTAGRSYFGKLAEAGTVQRPRGAEAQTKAVNETTQAVGVL